MLALGLIEVIGLPPAIEAADAALKAANVTLLAIAKADAGILTVEITGDVGAVTAAVDAGAAAASRVGTLRAKHIIPRVDESLNGKVIMQGTKLFQPKRKVTGNIISSNMSQDIPVGTFVKNDDLEKSKRLEDTENKVNDENSNLAENSKIVDNQTISDYLGDTTKENSQVNNNQVDSNQTSNSQADISQIDNNKKEANQKTDTIEYTEAELKRLNNDALRDILQKQGVKLTNKHMNAKKQDLIKLILTMQNNR